MTILGTNVETLTYSEICQEIEALKTDLTIVKAYHAGMIAYFSLQELTAYKTEDEQLLNQAIDLFTVHKIEKRRI